MVEVLIEEPLDAVPGVSSSHRHEPQSMKLLSCVMRPESLEAVKNALDQLGMVGGMTVTDVRGFGRQKGQVEHYRGEEYRVRLLPKVRLEMAVRNENVDAIITAVRQAACTGQVGDGKVFVLDLRNAMRIRTGEKGTSAL